MKRWHIGLVALVIWLAVMDLAKSLARRLVQVVRPWEGRTCENCGWCGHGLCREGKTGFRGNEPFGVKRYDYSTSPVRLIGLAPACPDIKLRWLKPKD